MFTRSSAANNNNGGAAAASSATTNNNGGGGGRRAFRDVTTNMTNRNNGPAAGGGGGKAGKNGGKNAATKRTTRSMSMERAQKAAAAANADSSNHQMEERDPSATSDRDGGAMTKAFRGRVLKAEPGSYQVTGNLDDIDDRDKEDPLCATAYVEEMYATFREKEVTTSVRPLYMETQKYINERMRAILVDWLVEVHLKFKLVPETLYLTVNLIDRYLERSEVSRPKLQLVGVTCLLIAAKYEEIYPPELRDLVYICDRAYTKNDIIEMEEKVLKTLEYKITIPSAHVFLVRFLKAGHADKKIVQLSCYILDGTLQSFNLLHYLPSQLAAAAVFLARRTVGRNGWSPTLLHYAEYCEEEIIPIAKAILAEKNTSNQELRAVNKKYTSQRYGAIAGTSLSNDF